jgi:hypothetical protein
VTFGPEYHKIQTIFKRDEKKRIIPGDWSEPEFEYLKDATWRWTEKIDGTNIRIHWDGQRVAIGGRTDNAQIPTFLLAAIQPALAAEGFTKRFPDCDDVTLYGEGYGQKIQKGEHYRPDNGLALFDVRIGPWWLEPENVAGIAASFGFESAPEVARVSLSEAVAMVREERIVSRWLGAHPEGLVGTPLVQLFDRKGHRIVAKIKVRDFDHLRGAALAKGAGQAGAGEGRDG